MLTSTTIHDEFTTDNHPFSSIIHSLQIIRKNIFTMGWYGQPFERILKSSLWSRRDSRGFGSKSSSTKYKVSKSFTLSLNTLQEKVHNTLYKTTCFVLNKEAELHGILLIPKAVSRMGDAGDC